MKREAKILLTKATDSLVLSVEHFNRPWDRGRPEVVLILLDRSFELLLKAAILRRGGRIREPRAKETIGFDKCVRKCLSEDSLKCLTPEQAITAQLINSLRDSAQHHILEISERQLYVAVQGGVTVFSDLFTHIFKKRLFDDLPERVIPISTRPPTSLEVLMKLEFREIKHLLSRRKRDVLKAKGKMRTLATIEASLRGEKLQPGDTQLNQLLRAVKQAPHWRKVFPGISSLNLKTTDSGIPIHLRLTKKQGQAVHLVPEGTPGATTIAVRRVNELGYYNLGLRTLATKVKISEPKLLEVIHHLKIQDSDEYFKEIPIGKSRFKRYSLKALELLKGEIPKLDIQQLWEKRGK